MPQTLKDKLTAKIKNIFPNIRPQWPSIVPIELSHFLQRYLLQDLPAEQGIGIVLEMHPGLTIDNRPAVGRTLGEMCPEPASVTGFLVEEGVGSFLYIRGRYLWF